MNIKHIILMSTLLVPVLHSVPSKTGFGKDASYGKSVKTIPVIAEVKTTSVPSTINPDESVSTISVLPEVEKPNFGKFFEKMTPLIQQKMELDRRHREEKNSAALGINQVVRENLPAIEQKLKDCNEYLTQYETSREKVWWQDHELEAKLYACQYLAALTRLATTFGKMGSPAGRSEAGNQFEDKASELGFRKLSTIGTYKYLHHLKELR